jgi:DNA-directed RNA polymerase subunit RPC12/RpoP
MMDARRQVQCPTCTIEFTLDVPRTWVRCPSCGHGFVVKRISRGMKSGWLVTGPDGVALRFGKVDDLREAIARGDLEDPAPESEPMDVSLSEVEVAPPVAQVVEVAPPVAEVAEPSGTEIAPGVTVVPLDALDHLERRSDAPPSGERDRATRRSTPPTARADRPASVSPPPPSVRPPDVAGTSPEDSPEKSPEKSPENVTEFADVHDVDDLDDDPEIERRAAEIEETPLITSQTAVSSPPPSSRPIVAKSTKPPAPTAPPHGGSTSVARSVAPETPSRSWTLPLLGVAAAGAIAWAFIGGRGKQHEPTPGTAARGETTSLTVAAATPTAAGSGTTSHPSAGATEPPAANVPVADAPVFVMPAATALSARQTSPTDTPRGVPSALPSAAASAVRAMSPDGGGGGDAGGGPEASLRAQATSAFRAGDFPKARSIDEQLVAKNPRDVDAWSALGDSARAQGSMADAESAYRRALGLNPLYLPSLIGLADLGWDNGDRAGAQRRYADLVERFPPDGLPERVKQRAK